MQARNTLMHADGCYAWQQAILTETPSTSLDTESPPMELKDLSEGYRLWTRSRTVPGAIATLAN